MSKILPDMICRIINLPPNTNRLVRTRVICAHGLWECEALQPIDGWAVVGGMTTGVPRRCAAGDLVDIDAKYLAPLPGDDDPGVDEMVKRVGKAPFFVTLGPAVAPWRT